MATGLGTNVLYNVTVCTESPRTTGSISANYEEKKFFSKNKKIWCDVGMDPESAQKEIFHRLPIIIDYLKMLDL